MHYRMFKHWGFERIAKKEYDEFIGEMKHAEALMERLFMLELVDKVGEKNYLQTQMGS